MKHGKHLRKKENRAGRSVWHRCLAVLLSAAMLAGVMIPSAAGAGLGSECGIQRQNRKGYRRHR